MINSESGVSDFIDPLAGSYVIESLTDSIEEKARALIGKIDDLGGVVRAIEAGWIQRQIMDTSYRFQKGVDSADIEVVGVNVHVAESEPPTDIQKIDPAGARDQVARTRALRESRDGAAAQARLDELQEAARGTDNLMPYIVRCVRARCTLGEISGAMKDVFGAYRETIVV